MIVDRHHRLMDAEALSIYLRRAPSMVWKYARVVGLDEKTGRKLFHADTEMERFKAIPRRKTEQQMARVHGWLEPS